MLFVGSFIGLEEIDYNIAPACTRTGDLTEHVDNAIVPLGNNARGQQVI